jgi:hypothetical protein
MSAMSTGFADESVRMNPEGLYYVLGAAVILRADEDDARDHMFKLRDRHQPTVHWHSESDERRSRIVRTLSPMGLVVVASVRFPVAPTREERARQMCLGALAGQLHTAGVGNMVIEARQRSQNKRDRSTLAAAARPVGVAPGLRYSHVPKRADPLLWIADVVAGVVGLYVTGENPSYLAELRLSTLIIDQIRA